MIIPFPDSDPNLLRYGAQQGCEEVGHLIFRRLGIVRSDPGATLAPGFRESQRLHSYKSQHTIENPSDLYVELCVCVGQGQGGLISIDNNYEV